MHNKTTANIMPSSPKSFFFFVLHNIMKSDELSGVSFSVKKKKKFLNLSGAKDCGRSKYAKNTQNASFKTRQIKNMKWRPPIKDVSN